jgi:hypothetical protein
MAQEVKEQEIGGELRRYRDPFVEIRAEMDRVFDFFLSRGLFARTSQFDAAAVACDVDVLEELEGNRF